MAGESIFLICLGFFVAGRLVINYLKYNRFKLI